ncbi:hypothetical protein [Streptomyces hydrogenans]|uniref:hypothetical protein n=1 Tax=Streptomyces hydrogenans TaxID=1873719 RepID=UPI00342D49A6
MDEANSWAADIIKDRPESLIVKVGKFSKDGQVGDSSIRFVVSFDEDLPNYVKLAYCVGDDLLCAQSHSSVEHARLFAAVDWACRSANIVFGHFSYVHTGGATELEAYLRGPAGVPSSNTPKWRERLRGYSWLMVASRDIAEAAGGVDALLTSDAFEYASALPNGSVLLQATSEFQQYTGDRVRRVHQSLREFLINGEFRRPAPVPGCPPLHMVIFES